MNRNFISRKIISRKEVRSLSSCFSANLKNCKNVVMLMLFALVFNNTAMAQDCVSGALICNDLVNVSLDENCSAVITPDMVLEGTYDDYSIYTVTFTDEDGTDLGNVLGLDQVNENVMVTVSDNCPVPNSCWGTVFVEDKLAPVVICPDDILILPGEDPLFICSDLDDIYTPEETALEDGTALDTGNPDVSDNCDVVSVTYSDALTDGETCDNDVIIRTFTATDQSGNTGTCEQIITIGRPTIDDAIMPEPITVNCNLLSDVLPQTLYDLGLDGFPVVESYYDTTAINEIYCNLGASYHDAPIVDLCGGGYKVLRTWTVIDWCTQESTISIQIIKVEDTNGPTFDCPVYEDANAITANGQCQATITILDIVDFADNCSGIGNVVVVLNGVEHGVGDVLTLSAGSHEFTYYVTDECENEATLCTTTLNIIDTTPPVAICDEHTTVSLGNDGSAFVCWQTFDDGSYDNCSDVVIRVKRMDDPTPVDFTECVEFNCSDVGDVVMVRMRVYDIVSNEAFDDNDDESRYNECMIEVSVEDKLAPVITCPPNKNYDCQAQYEVVTEVSPTDNGGLETFYNGEMIGYYLAASDNCNATINITDAGTLDNCGEGTIVRTWTITDDGDLSTSCDQLLIFTNPEPFNPGDITWPADPTVNCVGNAGTDPENLPAGFDYPGIAEDACDLVATTYEDQLLEITEDACYKILRHWIVVDWCQYDDSVTPTAGYWEHLQVIKVYDDIAPTILSDCADIDVCNEEIDCGPAFAELILDAEDSSCAAAGDLNYSYTIDAFNDGITDPGSAFNGDSNNASGNYPNGVHHIYWEVEDNCGNISYCDYTFTIADCKKPTPVLINGLATVVMPFGQEITLWANDFNATGSGSFDNCTASEDLEFYVRKIEPGQALLSTIEEIEALGTGVTFTCNDLGFTEVEIYVVDENDNWDYGVTYANIQDPNNACLGGDPAFELAGSIYTEIDDMVEDVNVSLNSNAISVPDFLTDNSGSFNFGVVANANYTIDPAKNVGPLNGVTTYDLVLISKHILGNQLLDSPYKIIAADANASSSLTTFDIVILRRLILNIDTEFTNNTSWRFVDADFVFADASNPFATVFPEIIAVNDVDQMYMENNFIAVKVGDVNSTATANNLLGTQARDFAGSLTFQTKEQTLVAGQSYEVAINAKDFKTILGYQHTIRFNATALDFVELKEGQLPNLTEANFGFTALENGVITTSWNNSKASSLENDATVYTLHFVAKKAGLLSEVLSINSEATPAEAYSNEETLDVQLAFVGKEGTTVSNGFELYQNAPNPFSGTTLVPFNMPETGTATLTLYDVTGKVLNVVEGNYGKGYNTIQIEKTTLPSSGLVYYELKTATNKAVKLMMVTE